MREAPSYDNIYLRPNFSTLCHRAEASTKTTFLGREFELPVVPSNMEDVVSFENAKWLSINGYFYIMHRFKDASFRFVEYAVANNLPYISISVGVGKESQIELDEVLSKFGNVVDFLTVDVAHGHHQNVEDMMKFIQKMFRGGCRMPKIIAGNVATLQGYQFLQGLGVDAVKLGIGGGSICTTRFETGFHWPTAASLLECSEAYALSSPSVPIIADGGIKHHGDIAKALVLGASMVMCGGLFASCIDSPARIVGGKKIYRGSTSYEAKGNDNHVEGTTLELEGDMTYAKRMEKIQQALRSSISYAGGKDLSAFKNVEWHIV